LPFSVRLICCHLRFHLYSPGLSEGFAFVFHAVLSMRVTSAPSTAAVAAVASVMDVAGFEWDTFPQVAACCVALYLSAVLCSAGGVGGGGVYVAVLMVIGGLSPRDAVPLSKAVVFFGAMASLFINMIRQKTTNDSVIDFNVCRMVVPAALAGTFFGVLLNYHSHDLVILVSLSALLCVMSSLAMKTACEQYNTEVTAEAANVPIAAAGAENTSPVDEDPLASRQDNASKDVTQSEVVMAGALLVFVIACGALRHHHLQCLEAGGLCRLGLAGTVFVTSETGSRLTQASLLGLPIFACMVVAALCTQKVVNSDVKKENGWTMRKAAIYQSMAGATGCLAGLVGIGGGLVFSPFFLLMGMDPAVAVGTSSTCVLFTSTSTTMQYALSGRIAFSLAVIYGLVCLLASAQGTSLVLQLRERFPGRKSYISGIVVSTVLLSVALVVVKMVVTVRAAMAPAPLQPTHSSL